MTEEMAHKVNEVMKLFWENGYPVTTPVAFEWGTPKSMMAVVDMTSIIEENNIDPEYILKQLNKLKVNVHHVR